MIALLVYHVQVLLDRMPFKHDILRITYNIASNTTETVAYAYLDANAFYFDSFIAFFKHLDKASYMLKIKRGAPYPDSSIALNPRP